MSVAEGSRDAEEPGTRVAGTRRLRRAPSPLVVMAGDDRQLAAQADRGAERWPEAPAGQAGARPRTVPAGGQEPSGPQYPHADR